MRGAPSGNVATLPERARALPERSARVGQSALTHSRRTCHVRFYGMVGHDGWVRK